MTAPVPQKRSRSTGPEVLRKLWGISSTHIDGPEQPFGQQLICNCRSAGGKDGAFEDDGEAVIWFEPLDRRE